LFTWCRLVAQGSLTVAGSGEEVVPASDYRALQNQVRELHWLTNSFHKRLSSKGFFAFSKKFYNEFYRVLFSFRSSIGFSVRYVMADDSSRRNSTHSRQRLTLLMEPLLNAFEHGSNEDAAMFGAKLVDNPRHCIGIERSHRTEHGHKHGFGRAICWSFFHDRSTYRVIG